MSEKQLQFPIPAYLVALWPTIIALYQAEVVGKGDLGLLYTTSKLLWCTCNDSMMEKGISTDPTAEASHRKLVYDLVSATNLIQKSYKDVVAIRQDELDQAEEKVNEVIRSIHSAQQTVLFKRELVRQLDQVQLPTIAALYAKLQTAT